MRLRTVAVRVGWILFASMMSALELGIPRLTWSWCRLHWRLVHDLLFVYKPFGNHTMCDHRESPSVHPLE